MTGAEQKKELHSSVYDIAKRLRGLVLANNYKDYILGIVFYRFLSEKIENRADKLLAEDNISYAEAWKDEEYKELLIENLTKQVGYIIEPGDLFSQFVKDIENGKFDIEKLQFAINNLVDSTRGKESEDDFNNLFDGMVLSSHIIGNSVKERSQTLSEIIGGVNNIDFSHDETEVDVLGDIYEYIIKYFASNAGQKAGEFYTPQPVSTLTVSANSFISRFLSALSKLLYSTIIELSLSNVGTTLFKKLLIKSTLRLKSSLSALSK